MRSFRRIWVGCFAIAYAGALVLVQACDGDTPASSGGNGGNGGSGGACDVFGPVNPDACTNEGTMCFFADTSCQQTWTCQMGEWDSATSCMEPTTSGGGNGGAGVAGAGGNGGNGGSGGM